MKSLQQIIKEGLFDNIGLGPIHQIEEWIKNASFDMSIGVNVYYDDKVDKYIVNGQCIWLDKVDSVTNNNMFEYGDKIQEFILTGNKTIKNLEGCPKKCKYVFRCDQCPKIKSLEGAPQECMTFDAHSTNITELKGIDKLKCEVLDLSFCTKLTSLKGCPKKCEILDIYGCDKLKDLTGCPNCRKITANNCHGLESIKGIGKHVEELQIENCKNLKSLEDLPDTCKRLRIYNCKNLNRSTIKVKNIDIIE